MDDLFNNHRGVILFDDDWQKKQNLNDPSVIEELLLTQLPKDGKYDRARVLIKEVCNRNFRTDNYYIARRLWKDSRNDGKRKITKGDYQSSKEKYLERIKNLCKTVRRWIKPAGYTVSHYSSYTEISKLK